MLRARRSPPRSGPRPFVRNRILATALAVAVSGGTACLNDRATGPEVGGEARLAINAQVSAGSGAQLRVHVFYLRTPTQSQADTGQLLDVRVPIGETAFVPVTFDVTRCLRDRARLVPGPFCDVVAELELLDAAATILDRAVVDALQARPGQTDTVPDAIRLFQISRVDVSASATTLLIGNTVQLTATPLDIAARPVTRPVTFASANPAVATVDANTGLVTGVAEGSATVTASSGGKSADVALVVTRRPAIALDPRVVQFAGARGTRPGAQTVTITNSGGGVLDNLSIAGVTFAAGQPAGWLEVSAPSTSTAPATFTIQPAASVARAPLPVGSYTAFVRVASPAASNSPDSVQVRYTVTEGPAIALDPRVVQFAGARGTRPAAQTVTITNGGGGVLDELSIAGITFAAGQPEGWLEVSAASTSTAPATFTVQPAASVIQSPLAVGSYTAFVKVASAAASNSPDSVQVTYTVADGPAIGVAPAAVQFSATAGSSPAALRATVQVTNTNPDGGALTGLSASVRFVSPAGAAAWLSAAIAPATAPATLTVAVTTTNLAPGPYVAEVTVASGVAGVAPQTVRVTLNVLRAPSIVVSTSAVAFRVIAGDPLPAAQIVNVTNGGDGSIDQLTATIQYNGNEPGGWLLARITPTSATATSPAALSLSATRTNLGAGRYTARVIIGSATPGALPVVVTVTLDVSVRIIRIATGGHHSCGLTATGSAYCWGGNEAGQLGDGSTSDRRQPTPVAGDYRFVQINAGGAATCGITATTDEIVCWGSSPAPSAQPTTIARGGGYGSITLGRAHACVVGRATPGRTNLFCWGDGASGQVGAGTDQCVGRPCTALQAVLDTATYAGVSAGERHSCGVTAGRVARCWGSNNAGQLGANPTTQSSYSPLTITFRSPAFTVVHAGGANSCGISDGALFCWGQFATVDTLRYMPVAIPGAAGSTDVTVGYTQFCAFGGTPVCWGVNGWGEVGNNTTRRVYPPVTVAQPASLASISAGGAFVGNGPAVAHSCGIAAGVAYCWGANNRGQVGDGTLSTGPDKLQPTRVAGQP